MIKNITDLENIAKYICEECIGENMKCIERDSFDNELVVVMSRRRLVEYTFVYNTELQFFTIELAYFYGENTIDIYDSMIIELSLGELPTMTEDSLLAYVTSNFPSHLSVDSLNNFYKYVIKQLEKIDKQVINMHDEYPEFSSYIDDKIKEMTFYK